MRYALVAVLSLAGLVGCVDHGAGPPPKKIDAAWVQSHLLGAVPADLERLDVSFGDVVYVGNKVDRTRVAPGGLATITHYWQVNQPIAKHWKVFTLLRGPAGSADFINLPATDMQIAHGPATWQAGEIIEDVQTFTVRPDWRSASATILIGLIESGAHGTLGRMEPRPEGPRTQDRAVVARTLEIDLSRAPAPKGSAHIVRKPGPIVIDGVSTEMGWANAIQAELVTAEGSGEPIGKAIAKLTWDDEFLYVHVSVTDSDIVTPYKQQDDPLWKGDCVELFIDADNNKRGYVELQVNPHNATFDSWFAGTRSSPGDEAWDSGMQTMVKLRGTAEPGDTDQGWEAELAIPWAAVKGKDEAMAIRTPPAIGDRWRLNVVRVDRKSSGDPKAVTAASWNRITMADFHALDRMLTVVFADASGSIVPGAAPAHDPGSGAGSGSAASGSGGAASGSGGAAIGSGSAASGGGSAGSGSGSAGSGSGSAASGSGSAASGSGSGSGNTAGSGTAASGRAASGSGSGSAVTGRGSAGSGSSAGQVTATKLQMEVLATGVRFDGKTVPDAQLEAALRDKDRKIPVSLTTAPGVVVTRGPEIAGRVDKMGFAVSITLGK